MRQIVAADDLTRNFPAMKAGIDEVRNIPYHQILKIKYRSLTMTNVQELATLTSKGQITLPKFVRQALGVTTGGKVTFELRGNEVIVTRVETEHRDPAIGAFLNLLETDIRDGRNICRLPEELAQAMLANLEQPTDLDETIEGEVAL